MDILEKIPDNNYINVNMFLEPPPSKTYQRKSVGEKKRKRRRSPVKHCLIVYFHHSVSVRISVSLCYFQRFAATAGRGLTVEKILGAARLCLPTREIFYLLKFKGQIDAELVSSQIVRGLCPQILIEFFQNNMEIRKECELCP